MSGWERFVSTVGAARFVAVLGGLYVVLGAVQAVEDAMAGGSTGDVPVDFVLFAAPGAVLLYGGYRLAGTDLHDGVYPRVVGWCLGGFGVMLAVVGLLVLTPGWSIDRALRAALLATAFGSVGGLGVGLNEGRALTRAHEAERHNRELRRYETLIEEATDVNAVLDTDGTFRYLTPSVEHVLGYAQEELVGEEVFEYVHPDDLQEVSEGFAETVEGGRSRSVEFRFRGADGSWVVLEGKGRNLLDDPAVEGIVAYTHDVTERAEAQRELREQKERFESIVKEVEEYAIFELDPDGYVRTWNAGAEEIKGYEADEIVGEHFSRFYTEADREAGIPGENLRRASEEGSVEDEGWRVREDGSRFWASVTITALRDEDGSLRGFSKVARDTTERREYERRLEQYRTIAETASDVIVAIDEDSVVRSANPAVEDVFGYRPEELVGEPLTTVMPESLRGEHREAVERYLRTGERSLDWDYLELPGLHREGHEVPLAVSFSEFERDGERFFTGIIRDNTERKELENELRSTKEQYQQLVEGNLVGIYLVQDGEIEYVNPRFAEIFGYTPDELLSETEPLDHVAPEDREKVAGNLQARLEGEADAKQYTFTGVRKDGERIELEVHGGRVEYRGEPAVLGTMVDVTERERMEDELRQERDLRERIFETSPTGVLVVEADGTVSFANERAAELLDVPEEEMSDVESLLATVDVTTPEGTRAEGDLYRKILSANDPIRGVERRMIRPDGRTIWVSINGAPLRDSSGEVTGVVFTLEDVTERKHYRERLVSLNELSQDLTDVETERAVGDLVVETARDALSVPLVAIALYDEERGRLRHVARTPAVAELVGDGPLFESERCLPWRVYSDQTEAMYDDLPAGTDVPESETPLRSAMVFPLGEHGVLVAGGTTADAFGEHDASVAGMLAATTRSALDRVQRERALRERTDTLEEQKAALERVQRVNDVIRGITTDLIQASNREEVLQAVCDRLTDTGAYRFAWVGTHDAVTDEVAPEAWAGDEEGYLNAVTVTADESEEGQGPTGEAVRTRETRTRNDLAADPPFEPWRQAALDRGYRAAIAVPIVYRDAPYGVLTLYAGRPDAFNRMEEAVLTELGETIGYALNALERKRALVGEQSVELEFRLRSGDPPLFRFAAKHDCEFEFENVVQRSDGPPGIFVTIRGVSTEEVLAFGEDSPEIEGITLASEREDEALFEVRLSDSAFFSVLLDRGAMPRTLTASGDEGHAVIRVPRTSDIRTFVELFEARYDGVDLVGRREVDEPIRTQGEFEAEFRNRLTERQEEILKTAYASGFFEWPREMSAQDLAEMLGVSQPTVSRHIRTGEQKLFGLVFGEEGPSPGESE